MEWLLVPNLPAAGTRLIQPNGFMTNVWYRYFQTVTRAISDTCVVASLANPVIGVTGDGTTYDLAFDEKSVDRNNSYNVDTGLFVAPYTGVFKIDVQIDLEGMDANNTTLGVWLELQETDGGAIQNINIIGIWDIFGTVYSGASYMIFNGGALVPMNQKQKIQVKIVVDGNATANINIGSQASTFFYASNI